METISIAKVLKPQGIKGELKCQVLTEKFDIFSDLKSVICENKKINVISGVYRLGYVYIMLENVNSIEQANQFRNKTFYIPKAEYGDLDENNYFIDDLVGVKIETENGEKIGEVLDVENYGASDILIIKEKFCTYSVPFIAKVVLKVDINQKTIVVNKEQYEENKV
ncbi:MAG: ribosome maturation factor RimM [Clostridia bacterium]|nr:ribosome maturation factor RimM [Clostridia bacterium]